MRCTRPSGTAPAASMHCSILLLPLVAAVSAAAGLTEAPACSNAVRIVVFSKLPNASGLIQWEIAFLPVSSFRSTRAGGLLEGPSEAYFPVWRTIKSLKRGSFKSYAAFMVFSEHGESARWRSWRAIPVLDENNWSSSVYVVSRFSNHGGLLPN